MSAAFRSMGTSVHVVAPDLDAAAEEALVLDVARTFAESERRYSRFRPDSELSQLNRATGPHVVSRPLFEALRRARSYFELTEGLFDPTIGGALIAFGYARSFSPGVLDRDGAPSLPPRASMADVTLDPATCTVVRPPHVTLDLGGLIKGHTADRAGRKLPENGAVDAGGDAVVRGDGPEGAGWLVDVEDPHDPSRVALTVRARNRAIATSSPNRRRWKAGGRTVHHLIDPRTFEPSRSDLAQVTVLASFAELADVLAKTAFLLGRRSGGHFLSRLPGVGGVLIPDGGAPEITGDVEVVADA